MSDWTDIKEEIYTQLEAISTTDIDHPANYDWQTKRRLDKHIARTPKVTATIHYPEDEPFEEDVSIEKEASVGECIKKRVIDVQCKIKSKAAALRSLGIIDQNNDALDDALEDLKIVFGNFSLQTCNLGIQDVSGGVASKVEIESKSAYYPFMLVVRYEILYSTKRS